MGTTLTPIAVSLDKLTAVCGSGDRGLLDSVIKKFGREFWQFDEMGEDLDDLGEDDAPAGNSITMKEALGHLIMGEEYNQKAGFMYGFALQFICLHIGTRLPNDHWCSLSGWSWFPEVDNALETLGVPEERLRVQRHLTGRGSPVPIPVIEDFPAIGYLKQDEIKRVAEILDEGKVQSLEFETMRDIMKELLIWISKCIKLKRDLICFHA
jgi:hypothetical protein